MGETFLKESSKFKVLSAPIQAPGVCTGCGASSPEDRWYVDINLHIDFHGACYFCSFCFTEIANALGFLTSEQSSELIDELNATQMKLIDLSAKERAINDAVSILRDSGLLDIVDAGDSGISENSISESEGNNSESEQGNSKSDKQNSKQGPSGISTDGVDDLFRLI